MNPEPLKSKPDIADAHFGRIGAYALGGDHRASDTLTSGPRRYASDEEVVA